VVALSETRPRRILGFLTVSQASFLLAGLENRNTVGVTGALVHWFVVAAATTGLYCVYRGLEARFPTVSSPTGFLGLSNVAPRLAVFFALSGLALVGLPGTLGFAAEDLLFHGSLESHPWLGITLPLATAFNAITMYRLFATLFMGRSAAATPAMPDAMPRERWALTAVAAFLVVNGILPSLLVTLRGPAAEHIASILSRP
jgi:NADH-quinone oxidoreductase subunit M